MGGTGRKQPRVEKEAIMATAGAKRTTADRPKIVSLKLYHWNEPVRGTIQRIDADDDTELYLFKAEDDPDDEVPFGIADVETIYQEAGVKGAV